MTLHDHQMQPKDIRAILVQGPLLGQRLLLAGPVFEHTINDQKTYPILRAQQCGDELVGTPPLQDPPIPLRRRQQAAEMPLRGTD
jgi:hypothetical protein